VPSKIKYSGAMPPIPIQAQAALLDILRMAGVDSVLITSTTRTPEDQARIMYDNLERHGVAAQKDLYKAPGRAVIDVYFHFKAMGQTADRIKSEMTRKIQELGPQLISRHCAEPTVKSVFDVAPSSIPTEKKDAFESVVSGNDHVDKFLKPPTDPAYHIEINLV
jgi:hypothetical protein